MQNSNCLMISSPVLIIYTGSCNYSGKQSDVGALNLKKAPIPPLLYSAATHLWGTGSPQPAQAAPCSRHQLQGNLQSPKAYGPKWNENDVLCQK